MLIEAAALAMHLAAICHHGFVLLASGLRRSGRAVKTSYARLTLYLTRLRVRYFVQVSEKAKCPACGIRAEHRIAWADEYQAVMHECARCKAHWGERPVVRLEAWQVKPMPMPGEQPVDSTPKTTTKIHQVS